MRSFASTSQYVFMAWCLIKHAKEPVFVFRVYCLNAAYLAYLTHVM